MDWDSKITQYEQLSMNRVLRKSWGQVVKNLATAGVATLCSLCICVTCNKINPVEVCMPVLLLVSCLLSFSQKLFGQVSLG